VRHGNVDVGFCVSFVAGVVWRWFTSRFDAAAAVMKILAQPSQWESERWLRYYAGQWYKKNKKK
jgi:hypothetical protein